MALYGDSLQTMRAAVRGVKPNCSSDNIDRFLNKRVRDAITRKTWSESIKFGAVAIPNSYTAGTVSVTQGSTVVIGAGAGWPVADDINTIGPLPVKQPGATFITPASMTGIVPGRYVLLDTANPTLMEVVAVEVAAAKGFWARARNTHDANFTITKSSLANRQIRTNYPFYTVTAVIDSATIWIDLPWSQPNQTAVSYQIQQAYVVVDPYARRILYAWDPLQGIALDVTNWTLEQILVGDSQLTSTDNPIMMVNAPAGAGGVPQWFLYPPQSSARGIPLVFSTVWPKMVNDDDRPPSFLLPEIFIAGATADALRTRTITQEARQDLYFDPVLASEYERQYEALLDTADEEDQGRRNDRLQSYRLMAQGMYSATYLQSHIGWPSSYGGSQ